MQPAFSPTHTTRAQGTTYKAPFSIDLVYQVDGLAQEKRLSKRLGSLPIMLKSRACYLRNLSRSELVARKEEGTEFGGTFVCNGIERIIRLLVQNRRHYIMALRRSAYHKRGPSFTEMATLIRCVRPDESSLTTRCHYLVDGSCVFALTIRRAGEPPPSPPPLLPGSGLMRTLVIEGPIASAAPAVSQTIPFLCPRCCRILHPRGHPAQVLHGSVGPGAVRKAGALGGRGEPCLASQLASQ